jgi:hypothetical protein
MNPEDLEKLLEGMTEPDRDQLFRILRERYGVKIHELERRWNTTAEAILEAINSSGDLTQRGVRGILAEATFRTAVLPQRLARWREMLIVGEQPYDLALDDGAGVVRVQVKLQRLEKGNPKYFRNRPDCFVVETQRTRGGKRPDKQLSRPYRITEFDVLAVCLHPSSNDWTSFLFCAVIDLVVRKADPTMLEVFQPVPVNGSESWSRDFEYVVRRFRQQR